jgi:hypothetical protein
VGSQVAALSGTEVLRFAVGAVVDAWSAAQVLHGAV